MTFPERVVNHKSIQKYEKVCEKHLTIKKNILFLHPRFIQDHFPIYTKTQHCETF